MKSADRALLQHTLVYAPKLKFYDAISLWQKAGKCFAVAGEWEDSAIAFGRAAEYIAKVNTSVPEIGGEVFTPTPHSPPLISPLL
jgi:hypothetical protein